MKSFELILIRHAEVDVSFKGICYGAMDVPLSAKGRRESSEIARLLADEYRPTAIFDSGLSRTHFLAGRVAAALSTAPSRISDPRLRERDYGQWQGKTWDENHERDPTGLDRLIECPDSYRPPDGEATTEMQARVVGWFQELVHEHQTSETTLLAVSHSGPIAALCGFLSETPATQWQPFMLPTLGVVKIQQRTCTDTIEMEVRQRAFGEQD